MSGHPLMTTSEVAAELRVKYGAVRRWTDAGELTAVRVTPVADRRFWRAQVEAIKAGKPFGREQIGPLIDQLIDDAIGGRL